MRKTLLFCALLLCSGASTTYTATGHSTPTVRSAKAATAVYKCANGKTVVYHGNRDCAALRRCTYEVKTLTVSQAQASGLRGCLKCY